MGLVNAGPGRAAGPENATARLAPCRGFPDSRLEDENFELPWLQAALMPAMGLRSASQVPSKRTFPVMGETQM